MAEPIPDDTARRRGFAFPLLNMCLCDTSSGAPVKSGSVSKGDGAAEGPAKSNDACERAAAHYNFGTALQEQGKLSDAIHYYKEAIKLDPKCLDAHYNLGAAYQELQAREDVLWLRLTRARRKRRRR